jgi:hypothetical protein
MADSQTTFVKQTFGRQNIVREIFVFFLTDFDDRHLVNRQLTQRCLGDNYLAKDIWLKTFG